MDDLQRARRVSRTLCGLYVLAFGAILVPALTPVLVIFATGRLVGFARRKIAAAKAAPMLRDAAELDAQIARARAAGLL